MTDDLRPLQRALRALSFTAPLAADDVRYVERTDGLGARLLERVRARSLPRLMLAGPAGCGKSTEFVRLDLTAREDFLVVLCPCDRELDLYAADRVTITRYLLWRILFECTATSLKDVLALSPSIVRDALKSIGAASVKLPGSPRLFFSRAVVDGLEREAFIADTFARLAEEAQTKFLPLLLVVDGLEKVPPASFDRVVAALVRSPELDGCPSIVVVPTWSLQGRERQGAFGDADVFEVPVENKFLFVRRVIERRLGWVEERVELRDTEAFARRIIDSAQSSRVIVDWELHELARLSGGVVRDGLELASGACRAALAARERRVSPEHVETARQEIARAYQRIFSDDPDRVARFLDHVHAAGQLPGDPEWRDTLLGCGAVLLLGDGSYRVHPILAPLAKEESPA